MLSRQKRRQLARLEIEAGLFRLYDERQEAEEQAEQEWRECMEDVGELLNDLLGWDIGKLIQPYSALLSQMRA